MCLLEIYCSVLLAKPGQIKHWIYNLKVLSLSRYLGGFIKQKNRPFKKTNVKSENDDQLSYWRKSHGWTKVMVELIFFVAGFLYLCSFVVKFVAWCFCVYDNWFSIVDKRKSWLSIVVQVVYEIYSSFLLIIHILGLHQKKVFYICWVFHNLILNVDL